MASITGLPTEQHASYTVIIDQILAKADLNTISAKQIREGLQKQVPYDITPQKKAIKTLIMQRFDKFHEEQESRAAAAVETVERDPEPEEAQPDPAHEVKREVKHEVRHEAELVEPEVEHKPHTNGVVKDEVHSSIEPDASSVKRRVDSDETPSQASPPPAKKRKKQEIDADAALAAKLQAEENARSRPTRNGATRKAPPVVKKKSKKKSKDKVSAEDDSDIEGARSEKKVNRNSGFHKELTLSPALSALFDGVLQLSRPQATKRLWAYIKAKDLQEPSDKRTILCDDAMKAVFKQDKVNMFAMTKLMNQNMYADGE